MQMVKKIIISLILLPLIIMVLAPKTELYYLLEQRLKEQHIMITEGSIDEGLIGLTINDAVVSFEGASVASAKKIELSSLLLYTKIDLSHLVVMEGLGTEVSVENLRASNSIMSPLSIDISASSSLGDMKGVADLKANKIHIDISNETNGISRFKQYLKKGTDGWYYEQRI